jgi:hypothetical protein
MGSRIRTVMMCLLLAALPVQSWAVATMVNCGPTHHRMSAAMDTGAHVHDEESHEPHGHDHASHHHDTATSDQADRVDQGQADPDPKTASMGKFKCSACATCCLGMALPSPLLTFDASVSSETVQLGMPQGHVVFLTAGLERPPRSILA